jgi:hypothetical protein
MSAVTLHRMRPTFSGNGISCGNGTASAEADKCARRPYPTPAEAEAVLERQRHVATPYDPSEPLTAGECKRGK